jgi:hypothetical protein
VLDRPLAASHLPLQTATRPDARRSRIESMCGAMETWSGPRLFGHRDLPPRVAVRASLYVTTFNEALCDIVAVGRLITGSAHAGRRLGDTSVSEARTAPRRAARFRNPERGTRGMYSPCPSCAESADLQPLLMPEEGLEPPTRGL